MKKLRKITALMLSVCLLMSLVYTAVPTVSAAEVKAEDVSYEIRMDDLLITDNYCLGGLSESDKTAHIWGYSKPDGVVDVIFPEHVSGYEIRSIHYGLNSTYDYEYPGVASVTTPSTIGYLNGMHHFPGATRFNLNEGLATIGANCFSNTSAAAIELPSTVTSIESNAFGNSALVSIVLPPGISRIWSSTFVNCYNLRSVYIPPNVTRIDHSAFANCTSLTEIMIPRNTRDIDDSAFNGSALSTIYGYRNSVAESYAADHGYNFVALPEDYITGTSGDCTWRYSGGVLTISGNGDMEDFSGADNPWGSSDSVSNAYRNEIIEVIIEDGVTGIGNSAFDYCENLESVTIPDSVERIGEAAFYYCTKLQSITLPSNLKKIEYQCFMRCYALSDVTIPDKVESIESYAFCDCASLAEINIPKSVKSIKSMALANTPLTEITIPRETIDPEGVSTNNNNLKLKVYDNSAGLEKAKQLLNKGYIGGYEVILERVEPIEYNGHYYMYFDDKCSWDYAEFLCEARGGHLVTITDEGEQEFVESLKLQYAYNTVTAWLGGRRNLDNIEEWQWVTGEEWDYTNWKDGQPNYLTDDVLGMDPKQWSDERSETKYSILCEWESKSDIKSYDDKYYFNGHYYQVYFSTMNWEDAKKTCEECGGYLATVTSAEEQAFIETLKNNNSGTYWIGGRRNPENIEEWQWITGEEWNYTNWKDGQPNYLTDDVLAMDPNQWSDERSETKYYLICEWNSREDIKNFPLGAKEFNGNHYMVYTDKRRTWETAEEYCEYLGGHLATITSTEEQAFLESLNVNNQVLWLGGYRNPDNIEEWKWITGEEWDYTSWNSDQPNSLEDIYISMDRKQWSDEKSYQEYYVLCEWEKLPAASGDINGDGKVDINDVTAIQKFIAKLDTPTAEQLSLADAYADGVLNIIDATCVQKLIAGLVSTLPVTPVICDPEEELPPNQDN